MSIPLVQNNEKDSINTSIIAIKRNIERINMLLGLSNSEEIDTSMFATKDELQQAVTDLQPVNEVAVDNMHSVTSNAVALALSKCFPNYSQAQLIYNGTTEYNNNYVAPANGFLTCGGFGTNALNCYIRFEVGNIFLQQQMADSGMDIALVLPVRKGDIVKITLWLATYNRGLYFVPCN